MSASIEGMESLLQKLEELGSTENVSQAMGQACAIVEAAAKQAAPKDTGELRRSIESRIEGSGEAIRGVVFTPLEYAPYVEYGTGLFAENGGRTDVPWLYKDEKGETHITSGQKPQPYMRPALLNNKDKILKKLQEGMRHDN